MAEHSEQSQLSRAEAALRASEARFQRLFDNVPVGVYESTPDGRILMANPALAEMLGYSSVQELLEADIESDLYHDSAKRREFLARLERDGSLRNLEIELRRKDGRRLIVLENCRVQPSADGRSVTYEGMLVDITELRAQEEELRQAQKLQSIGKLAGGIAHDFNNLLTIINGYSDLMLSQLKDTDPAVLALSEIRKAGERAAQLTSQLLAFSRRQVLQPRVLDLNSIICGEEPILRRVLGDRIQLVTSLNAVLGKINADPAQLQHALLNLTLHARDAMPGGGWFRITTANRRLPSILGTLPAGNYVELRVSDTGTAMDPETLAHVFEPFYSTKLTDRGTGLGLPSVYGIVRQSGGDIQVTSTPGRGTEFQILFPAIAPEPVRLAVTASDGRGKETVLLADEQDDVRRLISKVLTTYGYVVLQAASGQEAIQLSGRHCGSIDILVTDVGLPGMNGVELARRLRAERPSLKVLCLSGYPDGVLAGLGSLPEGTEHLQKPFLPAALTTKMRALLETQ